MIDGWSTRMRSVESGKEARGAEVSKDGMLAGEGAACNSVVEGTDAAGGRSGA